MTDGSVARWQEQNRRFLALAVDELHARIEGENPEKARVQMTLLLEAMSHRPALLGLVEAFDLDPFEQDLVMLCFATELDPRFRTDPGAVTVGIALESLEGAHWTGVDKASTLRSWGILDVDRGDALADSTLRLADDVVRFLMGFDPRSSGDATFSFVPAPPAVVASQVALADELAQVIATTIGVTEQAPAVELHGASEEDRIAIADLCASAIDAVVMTADVRDLPTPGTELDATLSAWSRRGRLTSTLLCLTGADEREGDPTIRHRVDRALGRIRGPFFLSAERPTTFEPARPIIRRRIEALTAEERREIWQVCVDETRGRLRSRRTRGLAAELTAIAHDFKLGARSMRRVCLEAEAVLAGGDGAGKGVDPLHLSALLRDGCAGAVRARLDPLAERVAVESAAEVALPEAEAHQLAELELSIRLSHEVSTQWGLGRGRASGVTALFAGPSGTGKTHAAIALARRLGLDLYRVDLASVMSKYIGETEKNLDRIFDATSIGGVILLFDEADALFGKRSEVRDSHDRYANLGTAYLLARIERAPTPTILTTNLKDAIDPAFLRRLHFVIDFPFPAEQQRREIWQTIYPRQTPVHDLEPESLAVITATGGMISNIARRGAFLAAAEPSAVEMRHLLEGARRELRKVGRDLTPDELKVWP